MNGKIELEQTDHIYAFAREGTWMSQEVGEDRSNVQYVHWSVH